VRRIARYVLRRRKRHTEPPGRPKLLIFDFDGTIADTFDIAVTILNKLAGEFGFRALHPKDLERARDMRTRQLMRFLHIPTRKMSRLARRGSEELHACIHSVQPLPGMPQALRELQALGYSLGIITSNTEVNVDIFLRGHGLDLFDFVRCSSKLLGKARMIRSVIRRLHVRATEILFVGDETRDIEAAKKVGIRMAAVTWGYNSRRSLEAMRPDFVFESPSELVAFLANSYPLESAAASSASPETTNATPTPATFDAANPTVLNSAPAQPG
jgi:phosphoglycolate phosphatase